MKKIFLASMMAILVLTSCSDSKKDDVIKVTRGSLKNEFLYNPQTYKELSVEVKKDYFPIFLSDDVMGRLNGTYGYDGSVKFNSYEEYMEQFSEDAVKDAIKDLVLRRNHNKHLGGLIDNNPRYYVVMITCEVENTAGEMSEAKFIGLVSENNPGTVLNIFDAGRDSFIKMYKTEKKMLAELAKEDPDNAKLYKMGEAYDAFILGE